MLFAFEGPPDHPSCVKHGPGGYAHGFIPGAHVIGMRKAYALVRQLLEVGSMDLLIAVRLEGIITVIIREDENDVRLHRWLFITGA